MTFDLAQMIANMTPITPAQRQEQRIGFCFSGLKADTKLTREAVAQMDYAIHGNLTALEDEIIRLTARVAELEGAISYIADGFGLNAPAFATPIFEEEDDDSLEDSEWIFEVIRAALSTHTEEPKT